MCLLCRKRSSSAGKDNDTAVDIDVIHVPVRQKAQIVLKQQKATQKANIKDPFEDGSSYMFTSKEDVFS